jgi:hypothetical protein
VDVQMKRSASDGNVKRNKIERGKGEISWTGVSVREYANGDEEGASLYRSRRACGEESISPIGDTVRWTWNIPRIIPSTTKGASAPQHVRPSVRSARLDSTRHARGLGPARRATLQETI